MVQQAHDATEYIRVPVTATVNGAVIDPTSDAVSMAFLPDGTYPTSGDYKTGSWETDASGRHLARCLVGPGGAITLAAGVYVIWLKIIDSPEIPIRRVDTLTVF